MASQGPNYLYLTTIGRRSGLPREIEIWFTRHQGKYYVISYLYDGAHWLRNIRQNPQVTFRVGERRFNGTARIVDPQQETELCRAVQNLSDIKYGWSEGLIVELCAESEPGDLELPPQD